MDVRDYRERFIDTGSRVRANMSEEEESRLGNRVGDFTLLYTLGDPSSPIKRLSGTEETRSLKIVGYLFKANCDIEIPRAPYIVELDGVMDVGEATSVTVKSGEEFCLNIAEMAMLLAREEYAGSVTTEDDDVAHLGVRVVADKPKPIPTLTKASVGVLPLVPIGTVRKNEAGETVGIDLDPRFAALQTYADRVAYFKRSSADLRTRQQDVALAFGEYFKHGADSM